MSFWDMLSGFLKSMLDVVFENYFYEHEVEVGYGLVWNLHVINWRVSVNGYEFVSVSICPG